MDIGTESFRELPSGTESILLVEDDPSLLRAAVAVLTRQGYSVFPASNGEEALKMARKHTGEKLDLLLADVVMPQMGGKELAEEVKTILLETKVLYMSGYTGGSEASQAGLNADFDFLEKPFSTTELACRVREVLDQ